MLTFEELYSKVKLEMGDQLESKLEAYMEELIEKDEHDTRDKSMKIVEYVHSLWSERNPVVIVYFTPPYYPHVYVQGVTEKEKIYWLQWQMPCKRRRAIIMWCIKNSSHIYQI